MGLRRGNWIIGAIALIVFGLQAGLAQDEAARPEFYTAKVVPIFKANCFRCHGGMNHRGGLVMSSRAGMLRGGKHGAAIVPGDPARSLLLQLIKHQGPKEDPMPMPDKGKRIADADIATVERWIKAGAIMPIDQPKP